MTKLRLFFFTILSTLMALSSLAEDPILLTNGRWARILPGVFTTDGKSSIYFEDDEEAGISTFTVYDENFKEVNNFSTVRGQKVEEVEYSQTREYCYKKVVQSDIYYNNYILEINGQTEGLTINQVLDHVQYDDAVICKLIDGRSVVGWNFWYADMYGTSYPTSVYVEVDNVWKWASVEYSGEDYGPYGPYGEIQESHSTIQGHCQSAYLITEDGGDGEDQSLTHGIFSDDYNYIMGEYEKVEYSRINEERGTKSWGFNYFITKLCIYDSKGNVLSKISLPSGYYADDLSIIKMGDHAYLVVDAFIYNEFSNKYYAIVYKIEKMDESLSVKQVAVASHTKVSPQTPHKGETVNVTVDAEYAAEGGMVNVVSSNGISMLHTKLAPNQTMLTFDTSTFSKGLYVVHVSNARGVSEVAKIIVR